MIAMEQKKCPIASDSSGLLGSECNLSENGECVLNEIAKTLKEILQEVREIKQRVKLI